jgi:hypothetical protein
VALKMARLKDMRQTAVLAGFALLTGCGPTMSPSQPPIDAEPSLAAKRRA